MKIRAYAYKHGRKVSLDGLLLRVTSHDAEGRPATFEAVPDEETIDLRDPGNREFIVACVDPKAMKPRRRESGEA